MAGQVLPGYPIPLYPHTPTPYPPIPTPYPYPATPRPYTVPLPLPLLLTTGATRPGAANLTLLFLRNDHLQMQKRGVQPTAAAAGAGQGGRKRSPTAESVPPAAPYP